jgi:Tfp pilus assembly PilM family ATPase
MQDCFLSSISIPKVSDKELATLIPIEARKYLPVQVSEVKLSYWRTDIGDKNLGKEDTVIIVAVKNEIFQKYSNLSQKLGFKDFTFEIESLSGARTILRQIKEDIPMIHVDIGGRLSFVTFIHNRMVKASNIIQKGSFDNTSQISKILGVSIDVAEEAKRIFGYLGDNSSPHLAEIMTLASYPLFDDIKHLLLQHERKYNVNIEKVVLSGGGGLQKGVKKLLSEFLDKEVILVDAFADFVLPSNMREALSSEDGKYTIAAGLAMKNLSN